MGESRRFKQRKISDLFRLSMDEIRVADLVARQICLIAVASICRSEFDNEIEKTCRLANIRVPTTKENDGTVHEAPRRIQFNFKTVDVRWLRIIFMF